MLLQWRKSFKNPFPFDDRLVVIDNLDSTTIHHHLENLDPERTLVLVISKSGAIRKPVPRPPGAGA